MEHDCSDREHRARIPAQARRGTLGRRGALLAVWASGLALSTAGSRAAESATVVHPERGGLMLETEERRYLTGGGKPPAVPFIDSRLSIFVTDKATMGQITFEEVLQQLVGQGGDPALTAKQLFHSLWDSAATKPGAGGADAAAHHCDDQSAPNPTKRLSSLGGFPYRCPRPEQRQASEDPFDAATPWTNYIAIAYSNRFDLADPAGRDCGEYRVVFARASGTEDAKDPANNPAPALNRNLIIFEARVKNPAPPITLSSNPDAAPSKAAPPDSMANLKGCKPIIDAWVGLSDAGLTTVDRGKRLHDLYLKGIPSQNVGPFISVDNYRGDGQGQIRTNQFLDHGADPADPSTSGQFIWTLREFRVAREPAGTSTIQIVPQTVKANPATPLFDASASDDRALAFSDQVIGQLGPLAGGLGGEGNINTFSYNNPDEFNSFESDESSDPTVSDGGKLGSAFLRFRAGRGVIYGQLKQALLSKGSHLSPDQVVARLQTQTCSGCHRFSNKNLNATAVDPRAANPANDLGGGVNWTQSLGFTQESERDFEGGPDGNRSRFLISDLLKDVFLPARLDNIRRFLAQP